ncbi:MAG TPA: hydrogenase maturation nickel metallochaperone HypA [Bryobacteraceae bacterium]|jgi:hydrogenase nickel incorporation protein HypA/HybF|nr:hydrogenase maturation nickel metallochaperone HypA [Bryobacteraceae bacterium]
MHELSIALSIVEMAEEEAAARQARIRAVHLKLGRLSGVVKDALLASYDMAAAGTALEGSRLVIEEVPIVGYCAKCQARRGVDGVQWFLCPRCGSPISEILEGKELQVRALEIAE